YPFFPAVGEAMKQADTQPFSADATKLMDQLATVLSEVALGNTDPKAALEENFRYFRVHLNYIYFLERSLFSANTRNTLA
ncbi:hypothetical protein K0U00_35610, partial [Paenibacillus sepulcri]|nr:hypothetical protein [Paenibacillus sepulcri]